MELLILLVASKGHLLTRSEIAAQLWNREVFVDTEHGINTAVRKIRQVLRDDSEQPRFVQTVTGKGYRFIGTLELEADSSTVEDASLPPMPMPITAVGAAAVPGETTHAIAAEAGHRPEQKPPDDDGRAKPTRRNLILLGAAALLGGGGMWLRGRLFRRAVRERAINLVLPLPAGTAAADPGHILGSPVVAPDGTAVIVALNTGEESYLFIRRLDADLLVRMEGTRGGVQPFWSPDGLHVAFFADAKLKRMPVGGGSAITLCDASGSRGGSWGSSGVIIFGLNFHGIYQVPETGGTAALTTHLDSSAGENSHRNPVFLPDGLRFLYLARTDDPEKRAIYKDSLQPASGRLRIGVADGEFALGRDPEGEAWYLLTTQAGKIVAQPFDVRGGMLSGTSHVLLDRSGTVSASDTGVLAIRTEQQMLTRLLWLDRTGRQLGEVGDTNDYWNVAISPDDKSLLTVRHNFLTGVFKVWTASCTRGLLEPLSDSNHAGSAIWSRDSSMIYYTDYRRRKLIGHKVLASAPEEVVMDLEGKAAITVEDVSSNGNIMIGEIVADGAHSKIAWSETKKNPEWHSIGAYGPEGLHAKLSPDGKWLAFASFDTGKSEIYVIKFPENLQRQRISIDGGRTPCWNRDGKELFYVASDGGMMSVALTVGRALHASTPTKLFQSNLRLGSDRPLYGVTGDGQRFLVIDGESTSKESDIELVLHWPSLIGKMA